ncbi:FAD-dependent oxidoreductase [Pseudomonas oligotrophica]|uniref:FAD-dependent oxidoreductase n=1 Tax=Pseudomonas oligotrophica TaxID=2912055 RepID=UPI001F283E26|nr:FAD-dependent oxidoreductase [Pseudomonas oligotrophica]MCF7202367.1 FAD-dependent oxidoreductase [Pseudomonas oligotrophica]
MFKTWLCVVCGWIYNEALGWPQDGIVAGTRWEDVPEDWKCPECGVGKADFEMLDVTEEVAAVAENLSLPLPTQPTLEPQPAAAARGPIVIIGSGHAGYGLAQALRKADAQVEIRVLTLESGHLYSKPALSIGLAQGRSAEALAGEAPLALEQRLGLRIYPHCEVQRIDPAARRLHTSSGEMEYGQLVLACGASPIRVAIDGDTSGVVSVNNLEDYRAFRERLAGVRRVAILGAGLIGCEFANDLAASGFEVTVIGLGQWPMERLLPAQAGRHLQVALAAQGVGWFLDNTVQRIERTTAGQRLVLADGQQLEADLVLSAVGLRPNLALAECAGLAVGRGIRVDDCLQTSAPGIYALGDCIEIDGEVLPYLAPINQGIEALSQTLLGRPTAVRYPLMPVTVKTPAAPLCLLPPPAGSEGEWRHTATDDGLTAGCHDRHGQLCGFVLLGRQAQLQRNSWLQACQTTQRAVA